MEEVFFTYAEVIDYVDQILLVLKSILFMISLGVGCIVAHAVWGRLK